jgi:FkbM family methyltransferase
MTVVTALRSAAKALRRHPALNVPITNLLRGGLHGLGRQSPWLTKHLPRSGVVTVRLPNEARLRLWSRGDDWISTQIFWRGIPGYEPETVPAFYRLAEQAPITVDVGAYVGYFTVMAALANQAGRVIALEPSAATFDRLLRNLRLNGLSNVECRNVAAGASAGRADLHHMSHGLSMAASLDPRHLARWEHVRTPVQVVALDDLLSELAVGRVDLMKIDAEATEGAVLEGARRILDRDRPHIICEVLSPESGTRLTEILEPLGYRFFELSLEGPRQRPTPSHGSSWNYLCTTSPLSELPPLSLD